MKQFLDDGELEEMTIDELVEIARNGCPELQYEVSGIFNLDKDVEKVEELIKNGFIRSDVFRLENSIGNDVWINVLGDGS